MRGLGCEVRVAGTKLRGSGPVWWTEAMDADGIRAFYAELHAGDFRALAERLAEDVSFDFPGRRFGARVEGRRKVTVFLRQNQRLFEDGLRFDLTWVGTDGDRRIAQWTNAGRTRTGIDYANRGVTVFHIRDGVIAAIEDYLDTERLAETWPE